MIVYARIDLLVKRNARSSRNQMRYDESEAEKQDEMSYEASHAHTQIDIHVHGGGCCVRPEAYGTLSVDATPVNA